MPRIRAPLLTSCKEHESCGSSCDNGEDARIGCNIIKMTKGCNGTKTDGVQCTKRPMYNTPGELHGIFCAEHKAGGMIDVKSRRCTGKNANGTPCIKQPSYNAPGKSCGIFCAEHKANCMINVKARRCTGKNAD